jgi:hypothetical protein
MTNQDKRYKMKQKTFLFLLAGIFLLNFYLVSAENLPHKQNTDLEFAITSNTATSCIVTTINKPQGIILINQNGTKNSQTFNFTILAGNFTELGKYRVNIECLGGNSGYEEFEVTLNGNRPSEGILVVVFIIIFMIIFALSIFSLLNALQHVLDLNMDIKDTAFMMVSYFLMWIFYYFSFEYLGNEFINNILELAISIGAVTHIFLPLVGFMVSYIMQTLKFKQKQRVTY